VRVQATIIARPARFSEVMALGYRFRKPATRISSVTRSRSDEAAQGPSRSGSPSIASSPCTPVGADAPRNRMTIPMMSIDLEQVEVARHLTQFLILAGNLV
jgi:hypothetical protein